MGYRYGTLGSRSQQDVKAAVDEFMRGNEQSISLRLKMDSPGADSDSPTDSAPPMSPETAKRAFSGTPAPGSPSSGAASGTRGGEAGSLRKNVLSLGDQSQVFESLKAEEKARKEEEAMAAKEAAEAKAAEAAKKAARPPKANVVPKVWSKVGPSMQPKELNSKIPHGTSVITNESDVNPLCKVETEPGSTSYRFPVNSDLFEGEQLLVFRDPANEKRGGNGKYQKTLWEGKARMFKFQVQGKFKRQPRGPIYLQASVMDDKATMGMFSKRFAKLVGQFAGSSIPKAELDFSLKPGPGKPMGVLMKVDPSWISILREKGEPWELGKRMPTYKECLAKNGDDVGALQNVDLDATYTLEYYTANLDAINWMITGIAVMPNMSLDNFFPEYPHIKKATAGCCFFKERVNSADDFLLKPRSGATFAGCLLVNKPK